jgi:putative transposase
MPADFRAFLQVLSKSHEREPLQILAACLMPNHFHLVVRPTRNEQMTRFMHWAMTTHAVRYHRAHATVGRIWQGRFKAFPVQEDGHLLAVMRYVERNALRAGLVPVAERWPWGSLSWRISDSEPIPLESPPGGLPDQWAEWVNEPQTSAELQALRQCVQRQRPFGDAAWSRETAQRLGLQGSLRHWGHAS